MIPFFTINDFKEFANNNDLTKFKIKYYKGLGTSTDKEAMEYFQQIATHRK